MNQHLERLDQNLNVAHDALVPDISQIGVKKLSYDFFYISNFSPWIDLLIVVRTIKTLLTGFGSR